MFIIFWVLSWVFVVSVKVHLGEQAAYGLKYHQENTPAGTKPNDFGDKSLVEGSKALLASNHCQRGQSPLILGCHTWLDHLILDTSLDHIKGCVYHGADSATNGSSNKVSEELSLGRVPLRQSLPHSMDNTKIATVPRRMTPNCRFQPLEERQGTFLSKDLGDAIHGILVFASIVLVLHSDLDQLKADHHECLRNTGTDTGEHRQWLRHPGRSGQIQV